ncbi:MAG: hypothetical protein VKN13_00840 [Cyanobacteriota bacterium]|nr:hypothetical protein [Cyanobacteriota bacterium]
MSSPIPALLESVSPLRELLPGASLWALALYIPLSGPLTALDQALCASGLAEAWRLAALVTSSLALALAVGLVVDLLLALALGPGWSTSVGAMAAGWGLFLGLARRTDD